MSTASEERSPRLTAVMREGERVTPLELFFDLVFVLALTQCTTLMARSPTWIGPSLETLAILAAALSLLIVYEVTRYADVRERVRHQGSPALGPPP